MSCLPGEHRLAPATGAVLVLALHLTALGSGIQTRDATVRNATRDVLDRVESRLSLSPCARSVLERHGLPGHALANPAATAIRLESVVAGDPDGPLALAELAYRAGLRLQPHNPLLAATWYRSAAAAAGLGLLEPGTTCFDATIAVHNDAVARLLRLSQEERFRGQAHWTQTLAGVGVNVAAAQAFVDPARFSAVDIADDTHIRGLRNVYRTSGLGVPVVGLRLCDRQAPSEPSERFFPKRLRVGATALAVPGGGLAGGAWRVAPMTLVFHDPFQSRSVAVGGSRVLALATDTSTPLALQASPSLLALQTYLGLIASDFQQGIEPGLYMLRPYQPGKIPVVFVHGLSSNPAAFVQTINDLRNDPVIDRRFQFLLFAYPTGRPIPASALRLRQSLYEAESSFGTDPAFHQLVLVGHSMGGILTRMMVTDTGMVLWDAVFNVPHDRLQASPETGALLAEMLIYRPVPFVRRAVFIAAPHRGSRMADEPIGRLASRLVRPPREQQRIVDELTALNGPAVFKEDIFRGRSINSVGNLSPRSPVLLAVDQLPVAPGVPHHAITFEWAGMAPTDLVVPAWSSHLPGASSDNVFPGIHFSEQSPAAVAEVRRILLEHVASVDGR